MVHQRQGNGIGSKMEEILKNETEYNPDIISATVKYHLDYMYSDRFRREILESVNGEKTLVPIKSRRSCIPFNQLLDVISAEVQDLHQVIPNINGINKDVEQAYADVEAQLIAYSTDIRQLDANQIEVAIQQINSASLKSPDKTKYLTPLGYKRVGNRIVNGNVKFVNAGSTPKCMKQLAADIQELAQNADSMERDEYLKRAVQLQYRFIRIHPFPDSNGRTSRALLNMMTIPKGILIEVPKNIKTQFVRSQVATNSIVDGLGYFEALQNGLPKLKTIEEATLDSPVFEFVSRNCVIDIQEQELQGSNGRERVSNIDMQPTEEL